MLAAPENLSKAIDPAAIKRVLSEVRARADESIATMELASVQSQIDYYEREAAQVRHIHDKILLSACPQMALDGHGGLILRSPGFESVAGGLLGEPGRGT